MTVNLNRNNWGAITCGGTNRSGGPCGKPAIRGTQPPRCERHSGKTKARTKAEGQIRLELAGWSLGATPLVDPSEQFLRLIAQSAKRAADLSELLSADFMDRGVASLIGVHYTADADGKKPVPSGDYIRGLTRLEAEERERCASWCAKAIVAGIEERRVRLAEKQFELMDQVLRAVLRELGHDPDSPAVRSVVSTKILELT